MDGFERKLWGDGYSRIAGVDEAGRGALAGPVVAAAVVFLPETENFGLRDSKKLSPSRREALYQEIEETAVSIGVGVVGPDEIDRINILRATLKAMDMAVSGLTPEPDYILIDGNQAIKTCIPHETIIKGDDRSISIAAASIIAKVTRDRMMRSLHNEFPVYDFLENKGYGTEGHREAIARYGHSAIHRKSFVLKSKDNIQLSIFSAIDR